MLLSGDVSMCRCFSLGVRLSVGLLPARPAADKYDTLKTFLLKLYELSELEKADRLLSLNGLGDGKPSDLVENMLAVLRIPLSSSHMFFYASSQLPSVQAWPAPRYPPVRIIAHWLPRQTGSSWPTSSSSCMPCCRTRAPPHRPCHRRTVRTPRLR